MMNGKVPERRRGPADAGRFLFLGERLTVDFLNTRIVHGGRPLELLGSPRALAAWADAAGVLSKRELLRDVRGRRAKAEMKRIWSLREALRGGLLRWRESGRASPRLLTLLNRELAGDPGFLELARAGSRVRARRRSTGPPLARLLAAIARSAAEMLEADDPTRFRTCADADCVLCFYDVSKAGRRRWCSMRLCGGRAKVRAYYRRRARRQATRAA